MCFRPSEVELPPVKCSTCGEEVFYSNGVLPNKCPFCREPLEATVNASSAPAAPGVPAAPDAPAAVPAAPAAPAAPAPSWKSAGGGAAPTAPEGDKPAPSSWKNAIGAAGAMPVAPREE